MKLAKIGFMPCNVRYLEVSIEEWLEDRERQLEDQGQVELVFRPFLRWLDRNIEDVVTEGLRQVITLHRVMMLMKKAAIMTLIKEEKNNLCACTACLTNAQFPQRIKVSEGYV